MRHDIVPNSCRICLISETELFSIYKPLENGMGTPSEMLQEVAGIVLEEVYEHPALPKSICKICIPLLNQAFRFRSKILESQSIISNHLLKECENAVVQAKQELEEEEILTDEEFQYSTEEQQVETEMPLPSCNNDAMKNVERIENIILDIKVEEEDVQENSCIGANDFNVQTFRHSNDDYNDDDDIKVSGSIKNSPITKENSNENNLVAKIQKSWASKRTCDICGKIFKNPKLMKLHRQRHYTEFQHFCTKCDKLFKTVWELNQHKPVHSDQKPYVCNVCNKSFKILAYLQRHMSVHIGIKLRHCKLCNMDFLQQSDFYKHINMKCHQKAVISTKKKEKQSDVNKLYSVEIKGNATKDSKVKSIIYFDDGCDDNMNDNSEGDQNCDICGEIFAVRSSMLKHRQLHYTEIWHACTMCDERFKMLSDLNQHKTVHNDHSPYVCDICKKVFNTLDVLKSHKSMHTRFVK